MGTWPSVVPTRSPTAKTEVNSDKSEVADDQQRVVMELSGGAWEAPGGWTSV
jgi:hypothetical protein